MFKKKNMSTFKIMDTLGQRKKLQLLKRFASLKRNPELFTRATGMVP